MSLLEAAQADQLLRYLRGTQPDALFTEAERETIGAPPVLTRALRADLDVVEDASASRQQKIDAIRRITRTSQQRRTR